MRVIRVIPDIPVPDVAEARGFYGEYLGLPEQDMGLDWVTRFLVPDTNGQLQLVARDASAPVNPAAAVKVDDVDEAYAEAVRRGYEIVHPLTTEPWGVRRFFVRAPDGTVFNIVRHVEP